MVSRRVAYSQDQVDSLSTQRSLNSDLGETPHPIAKVCQGSECPDGTGMGAEQGC